MEPFALFNLLKTLLPQTEKPEEPTSPDAPNTTTPPPQKTAETTPAPFTQPAPSNSFLDFAQRHDERARRIKKK